MESVKGKCGCGVEFNFNPVGAFNLYHCGANAFIFEKDMVLECAMCGEKVLIGKGSKSGIHCVKCKSTIYKTTHTEIEEEEVPDDKDKDPDVVKLYEDNVTMHQLKSFIKLKNLDVSINKDNIEQARERVRKAWEESSDNPDNEKEE